MLSVSYQQRQLSFDKQQAHLEKFSFAKASKFLFLQTKTGRENHFFSNKQSRYNMVFCNQRKSFQTPNFTLFHFYFVFFFSFSLSWISLMTLYDNVLSPKAASSAVSFAEVIIREVRLRKESVVLHRRTCWVYSLHWIILRL